VIQSLRRSDLSRRIPMPAKLGQMGIAQPAVVTSEDLTSVQ